jgi:hypothetical protein
MANVFILLEDIGQTRATCHESNHSKC